MLLRTRCDVFTRHRLRASTVQKFYKPFQLLKFCKHFRIEREVNKKKRLRKVIKRTYQYALSSFYNFYEFDRFPRNEPTWRVKTLFFQINYVNLHSFYGARQGKLTTSQQGADTVRSRLNITYHGLIKCFI